MRERERRADKNQECFYFWPQSERERERERKDEEIKGLKETTQAVHRGVNTERGKGEEMRALKKKKKKKEKGSEVKKYEVEEKCECTLRKCCGPRLH